MKKYLAHLYALAVIGITPIVTYGATVQTPKNFKGLVGIVTNIIETLIILVFALTFLVFMWGIIKGWIIEGGETEGIESGKKVVTAGIIGLVIMSSVWGIIYLFKSSLFGG